MLVRAILLLAVVLAVVGGVWLVSVREEAPVQPAPEVVLLPEVPSLDIELNNQLIDKFINEDEDIQAALKGDMLVEAATGTAPGLPGSEVKTNEDILFEMMAPWVYIRYQMVDGVKSGQFKNVNRQRKTPNLREGATLAGAQIVGLDPVKATLRFADATQELFLVSETPPPFDPTVPRTPEQIAEAQLRYKEIYMKRFIVSGKKYEELRGKPTVDIPPPEIQLQQKDEYLQYAEEMAAKAGGTTVPKEALIPLDDLSPREREAYETYISVLERSPEEIQEAIAAQRRRVQEDRQNLLNRNRPTTGAPNSN